ncbi:FTR1 family iron permease [Vibrio panuliri]|uniref:Iron permease n=1 Tax=Vibrio panuliri TaxID=1381081 RepID=A0ABX3FEJ9_9VIBR|nr:FTR1 family protein [Vibrio panuliri]KAB1454602.1 FTR1 family iron permease [Vibrio panuliri]OLQ90750.1 iron permease [Vibrio panuliri]
MIRKLSSIFVLLLAGIFSLSAWAIDYDAAVQDISSRLDKTAHLYEQGDKTQAKTTVQMAYFEVFESLEGPVRINYSQQYAYQLEAKFGEIRKMIVAGKPTSDVNAEIDWLKQEIAGLPEILASGHKLTAENTNLHADDILPFWRDAVTTIDTLLNQALVEYRESGEQPSKASEKQQLAFDLVQQAQFKGYKNTELEIAIRLNRSSERSAQYNAGFRSIAKITKLDYSQQNLIRFGYELSTLVQGLKDELPGLPATRDFQISNSANSNEQEVAARDWKPVVSDIMSAINEAISLYNAGDKAQAILAVQDAYFDHFEASGMENAVGSRDSALKSELEGYFTRIVSMLKANQAQSDIDQQVQKLKISLMDAADNLSEGSLGWWAMLIASFTIIFREGLEALLIVAAITAYLIKNDASNKLHVVKNSVVVGLIASAITAVLFQWLFENSGASRELLEGFTMLIAVAILFSMSYWLLSKVEAAQWKRYLENKLAASITTGSLFGLWLASFLAVYREGAETVLFYFALAADANTQTMTALIAGFALGVLVLTVIFFVMRYSVVKLPLKPFFIFTGAFMYLMAFVFAGKGVLELIEGKLFQPTLIANAPEFAPLGIYPYLETIVPQLALVVAAVFALIVMKVKNKREFAQQAKS